MVRLDVTIPAHVYEEYAHQADGDPEAVRDLIQRRLELCAGHTNPRDLHLPIETRAALQAHLGNDLNESNILAKVNHMVTLKLTSEDGEVMEVTLHTRALDRLKMRAKAMHKPYPELVQKAVQDGVSQAVGVFR